MKKQYIDKDDELGINNKLTQDDELCKMWAGFWVIWWSPKFNSSLVVLSMLNQLFDFEMKNEMKNKRATTK